MHAVRRLRDEWDELTVEGVRHYGTVAHGAARGLRLASRKLAEKVDR